MSILILEFARERTFLSEFETKNQANKPFYRASEVTYSGMVVVDSINSYNVNYHVEKLPKNRL